MQAATPPTPKKRSGLLVLVIVGGLLLLACPCIGGLSAIAIPAFIGYVRRAKVTEARGEVRAIARLEESYCTEHGNWLVPAGPVPAVPAATKQLGAFSDDPAFTQLGYDQGDPVYYSYSVEHDPAVTGGILIVARGDLDGDGTLSTFSVSCGSACTCEPTPIVTNEIE